MVGPGRADATEGGLLEHRLTILLAAELLLFRVGQQHLIRVLFPLIDRQIRRSFVLHPLFCDTHCPRSCEHGRISNRVRISVEAGPAPVTSHRKSSALAVWTSHGRSIPSRTISNDRTAPH